jgi:hypothetical protein
VPFHLTFEAREKEEGIVVVECVTFDAREREMTVSWWWQDVPPLQDRLSVHPKVPLFLELQ